MTFRRSLLALPAKAAGKRCIRHSYGAAPAQLPGAARVAVSRIDPNVALYDAPPLALPVLPGARPARLPGSAQRRKPPRHKTSGGRPSLICKTRFTSTTARSRSTTPGRDGRTLYSLIGMCRLDAVDPHLYLRYVLERIATHSINRAWRSCCHGESPSSCRKARCRALHPR